MNTHTLLIDPSLEGLEYGMLRDFESEICRVTGAGTLVLPSVETRLPIGTRYQNLRKFIPKTGLEVPGDVIWCIMMGPENCKIDLLNLRTKPGAIKILYLFDTFERQFPAINYILSRTDWDVLITSFDEAVPLLENATGRKWHVVPQGVKPERFVPAPHEQRIIGICSYGRRLQSLHQALLRFSKETGIYYDFTTWQTMRKDSGSDDLYRQYAWHLTHSCFSINLPVEVSNPERAGRLHPITCRWFEAAAAGTVILGMTPGSKSFENLFSKEIVSTINVGNSEKDITIQLRTVWDKRSELLERARAIRSSMIHTWTWEARILQILELTGLGQNPAPQPVALTP